MKDELIQKYHMLPSGGSVLCAVSGGADSMCLLHWLRSLQSDYDFNLYAAHFDHGLRDQESKRDAEFTREQCRLLEIPCIVGIGDVSQYAREKKLGIEEAARVLRYRFLEETADQLGCEKIATAHNLNDLAETVIMNLCRGSGSRGLAGIPPVRGRMIRPLLHTDRDEILQYLSEHKIPHIEDSSNTDQRFTRNRIRSQILPMLKEENPAILSAFGRTAELLREDDDCLCREAEMFLQMYLNGNRLPAKQLLKLEPAVAARAVRFLCGSGISMECTRALIEFARGTERGVLELPGQRVVRERGWLIFPNRN